MDKAILDFLEFSDANLKVKASFVLTSMTGNSYFPNPGVPLADLDKAINTYDEALTNAKTKDVVKAAVKNDVRTALEDILRELARYVNYIAKGNRAIILSSGFTVGSSGKSTSQLGTPQNFAVTTGEQSGQATMSIDPVDGSKGYVFLYRKASSTDNTWMHDISNMPYATIVDLEPLTEYCFCIGVSGSKGQKVYTGIIKKGVV